MADERQAAAPPTTPVAPPKSNGEDHYSLDNVEALDHHVRHNLTPLVKRLHSNLAELAGTFKQERERRKSNRRIDDKKHAGLVAELTAVRRAQEVQDAVLAELREAVAEVRRLATEVRQVLVGAQE